ncbi:protein phosphatase CheZ [Ectothiorhodospira lacustris]|uniref:protein phosphatase CheZ n=1 Tax=Ectothiorhodospira lacustris TaxID=2899127 RepID=UPI001EE96D3F|nr:protein phosphatase CheZ [Ectothiorhodospira lacustris]MCG5499511.1 protein phosphatase CheZ [Ectothiorhodospira lacustris]MCG5511089.1 protein phosphatase CheZ [Ectothiorhodospira lacustris]MCG5522903.1 protein phosphatase CheZ [Ectothiorhodospira lacustris]
MENQEDSKEALFKQQQLERARELVKLMESGNEEGAGRLIEEMGRMHESLLFQELGKLTRDLHEALNSFRLDSRLSELTHQDIPDAKERLNYVVAMTDQAAHRTLNAVEAALPVSEMLANRAQALRADWARFRQREMSVDEFRSVSQALAEFLEDTERDAETLRSQLSEVLMAQDFQDLTGQVIRRVMTLVQDLEDSLVGLVRISGKRLSTPEGKDRGAGTEPAGPAVKGTSDQGDVVKSQDDVDDLLSSLGF